VKKYVLYSHGLAGRAVKASGNGTGYVQSYDPDANGGRGSVVFTVHAYEAQIFDTSGEALLAWQRIPEVRKTREDGKPNRPLTAFHIEIRPVEEKDPRP